MYVIKENDRYSACNFCSYEGEVNLVSRDERNGLRISICNGCIHSLHKTIFPEGLRRHEAIALINIGCKLTHPSFTTLEFITRKNGLFVDECDSPLDWDNFWARRQDDKWNTGWSIYSTC